MPRAVSLFNRLTTHRSKAVRKANRSAFRRRFRTETLEARRLMASDVEDFTDGRIGISTMSAD